MIARRLVCLVRGHLWTLAADTTGSPGNSLLYRHTTFRCVRCGRLRRLIGA